MVEKDDRDARIQELYEQIEPLWTRLEVPKEEIDAFMESNRGSGLRNIQAVSCWSLLSLTQSTWTSSSVLRRSARPACLTSS